MLFYPVRFRGVRIPGLASLSRFFPRRVQQVRSVSRTGGSGWQGIVPSRAAKMGSISVDKGIAKLGSPKEFYESLDPDAIAEHIVESSRDDIRELVERTVQREHPGLERPPSRACARPSTRVCRTLPDVVRSVTDGIGRDIDHLMDVKLMVIRKMEERPELANRIFLEIGRKELKFIVNFGFWFRAPARDSDRDRHRAPAPSVVAAADRGRPDRLRDQPGRDPDDLRAGRGAPLRTPSGFKGCSYAGSRRSRGSTRRSSPRTSST